MCMKTIHFLFRETFFQQTFDISMVSLTSLAAAANMFMENIEQKAAMGFWV